MPKKPKKKPAWTKVVDTLFDDLSNQEIKNALERIINSNFPHNYFLAASNRYIINTVKKVEADFKKRPLLSKRKDISEYIAASSINHCSDSWNYLSRAVSSIINGDYTAAIHLAYYSELRSVMSIMAREGVGIFNAKHIWFKKNANCANFGGRTHEVANYIINKWAEQADKRDLVFNIIKVNNRSISQWLNSVNLPSKSKISKRLLKEWFHQWSIDLKIKEDQDIRNEVSYRPKVFYQTTNTQETISNIQKIWSACEPSNNEKFKNLDIHFLRIVLDFAYRFKTKGSGLNGNEASKIFIESCMLNLGLTINIPLVNFLSKSVNSEDHFILAEAKKNVFDIGAMTYNPFPIICRAFLLLRVATATTENLLEQSSISTTRRDSLEFWWRKICVTNGILDSTEDIDDFNDLYADIEESFATIDFADPTHWTSLKNVSDNYSLQIDKIKHFHRVGLWGLSL